MLHVGGCYFWRGAGKGENASYASRLHLVILLVLSGLLLLSLFSCRAGADSEILLYIIEGVKHSDSKSHGLQSSSLMVSICASAVMILRFFRPYARCICLELHAIQRMALPRDGEYSIYPNIAELFLPEVFESLRVPTLQSAVWRSIGQFGFTISVVDAMNITRS
jgi:hypothetical protein